jgi:integrase
MQAPAQAMAHKLKTKAGRALYALRKQTVEPVFGIIKSVLGFRQFSLRGLKKVTGRMDAGVPRVEFETHGRIASAVAKNRGNRASSGKNQRIPASQASISLNPGRVKSDRLLGAVRIKGRTSRPWHDLALYYMLFATGLRPLEIARLEVRDYLNADGSICRESELRAEAAINGKLRPLYFSSSRLDEALRAYFLERCDCGHGVGISGCYRGLRPDSRLFLSPCGEPYRIVPNNGEPGQNRFVCRALLETYRKLFRYADLKGLSAQSARLTVISRMYDRGADEDQVGVILGIGERSAVRELLPRPRPMLAELVDELV